MGGFWSSMWRAVRGGGAILVNTIGDEPEDVDALARTALSYAAAYAGDGNVQEAEAAQLQAGVFEPSGDADRATWTPLVPRPSMLALGGQGLLAPLAGPPRVLDAVLESVPWARQLSAGALKELASGQGPVGRWRS